MKSGTRQLRQHELRYFGVDRQTKKSDSSKPNSKPSIAAMRRFYEVNTEKKIEYDRKSFGSSEDEVPLETGMDSVENVRRYNTMNGSSLEITEVMPERRPELSPQRDRKQDEEILDELTRASEEILNVRTVALLI